MTFTLAVLIVLAGLLLADAIASEYTKRRNRRASEALHQRHRIGL